jgi:hypothetical protein
MPRARRLDANGRGGRASTPDATSTGDIVAPSERSRARDLDTVMCRDVLGVRTGAMGNLHNSWRDVVRVQ